jgi:FkbM family methyltransferase
MRKLISRLSRSAVLRRLVRTLRFHGLGNWWLGKFPLTKRLPGSGVIYRATRLESIPLAVEMFDQDRLYDPGLLPRDFTTFADLGCNVGYFTCWLAHLAQGRKLRGLMLDANPRAVEEAVWHARANGMDDVHGIYGIVGEGKPGDEAEFYLYESNICSASQVPDTVKLGLKGKWEKIEVPCVRVEEHWRRHFQEARCHLLKVDVEGSEMQFLKAETPFLERVDAILLEWHKWRVNLDEIKTFLAGQGFAFAKTLEENDQMGTAYFQRASQGS